MMKIFKNIVESVNQMGAITVSSSWPPFLPSLPTANSTILFNKINPSGNKKA